MDPVAFLRPDRLDVDVGPVISLQTIPRVWIEDAEVVGQPPVCA